MSTVILRLCDHYVYRKRGTRSEVHIAFRSNSNQHQAECRKKQIEREQNLSEDVTGKKQSQTSEKYHELNEIHKKISHPGVTK